jgi:hypothetical protein
MMVSSLIGGILPEVPWKKEPWDDRSAESAMSR